ncbi:HlyD family secretion protein [Paracoccus pacificus]|uniref:HlyD family secretion protein n=1 Tax=Paracoccus pacificus TaxID=1463598 RepID=A0ABW4RA32_9RHOB
MKNVKSLGLLAIAVLIGAGLWWWWEHGKTYPSTDDAYLGANIVNIAPEIAGRVIDVAVVENGYVAAGDVLFRLDPDAMTAAVDLAQAQLDQATQVAGVAGSDVTAAAAQVTNADAALRRAQLDFDRNERLFRLGDIAKAALDQATAARDQAEAQKQAAEAALAAARDQLGDTGEQNAGVRLALAGLKQAQLNLDHTTVLAPTSGWIANLTLRPGSYVAPGQQLFALVEEGAWWVDGNFKETDLRRIRPGQPVALEIDMYSGTKVKGVVDSIGAGSGAVFSLLPPENATGNWVKVTQRFPVRIRIEDTPDDKALQLRVGASVTATVDTSALDAK